MALSPQGLIELYQVRESLEGMAARLAATNMTDEEIADLSALLQSRHFDEVKGG
ncbi:FCD domain-containing protein [Paucibacter sp. O1-1]|nr:FCD domain-containing protein [Paucibacter sp. O1-1]MDA3826033.1 FCD domain-containing protein [Paucibacter sp. O1-1]